MSSDILSIDGNYLEGGGQIARTSLALSSLLGKDFEITSIRKGRCAGGGLKPQHLHCVKAMEDLCDAKHEGVELGACEMRFSPGKLKPQTLSIDIGTAGSITLMMQSLLLPAILGGGKFRFKITGGTDVHWSMPYDYFAEILIPQLRRWADIDLKLERRGYYPKGGGKIDLKIKGKFDMSNYKEAPKLNLTEQGELIQIKGVSHAATELQQAEVAERQARAAKQKLLELGVPVHIRTEYADSLCAGSGITLWAIYSKDPEDIDIMNPIRLGGDGLGERGKRAEIVGQEAAVMLMKEIRSKAPVDEHLADNLIPFMAFFGGEIKTTNISKHTLTNIYTCEQFLGKRFEVDEEKRIIKS